jgi:hypothetical protein
VHDISFSNEMKSITSILEVVVLIGNNHNRVYEALGEVNTNDCGTRRQEAQVSDR